MMRVPEIPLPSITPVAIDTPRLSAEAATPMAFGAAQGQGLTALGAGLSQATDHLVKIQQMDDVAAIQTAEAAHRDQISAVLHGTQQIDLLTGQPTAQPSGYLNQQGQAALDNLQDAKNQVRAIGQQIAGGLQNNNQKQLFQSTIEARTERTLMALDSHAAQQQQQLWLQGHQAEMAVKKSDMLAADPASPQYNRALTEGLSELQRFGEKTGLAPQLIEQQKRQLVSDGIVGQVQKLLVSDPLAAQSLYNATRSAVQGADQIKLDGQIHSSVDNAIADRAVAAVQGTGGPLLYQKVPAPQASSSPQQQPASAPPGSQSVAGLVSTAADQAGVSRSLALTTATIESAMGKDIRPMQGHTSQGVYGLSDQLWKDLGGTAENRGDTGTQISLGVKNLGAQQQMLQGVLGRQPEDWEVYLAHQQGPGGAKALFSAAPSQSAYDVLKGVYKGSDRLAGQALLDNGGKRADSVGDFVGRWKDRYQKTAAAAGGGTGTEENAAGPQPSSMPSAGWPAPDAIAADPQRALLQAQQALPQAQAKLMTMGLTTEQSNLALQKLSTDYNRISAAATADGNAVRTQVMDLLVNQKITDMAKIPPALLGKMTPDQKYTAGRIMAQNASGEEVRPNADNQRLWYQRRGEAVNDPAQFASRDLMQDYGKMPQSQWEQLVNIKGGLNKNALEQAQEQTNMAKALSWLKPDMAIAGLITKSSDSEQRKQQVTDLGYEFTGRLAEALTDWRTDHKGQQPGLEDVRQIGRTLLIQGKMQGSGWLSDDKGMAFQNDPRFVPNAASGEDQREAIQTWSALFGSAPTDQQLILSRQAEMQMHAVIPAADRAQIVQAYQQQRGAVPTPRQIAMLYTMNKMKGQGNGRNQQQPLSGSAAAPAVGIPPALAGYD